MEGKPQRLFLGWHAGALDRAAEWILARHGDDAGRVLVALPGSRAARALREKLARRARPAWTPPRVLTQGELVDEMVQLDRPVAGRLARTLAWAGALSELPRERLELVAARPPESGDLRAALALAETVRGLHADLAQEGIGFERLAAGPERPASAGDARRFDVLAEAQERWRAFLRELDLADPHEARFAAIGAGRIDPDRTVILVGVADMNRLLRRLVERLGARASALVVAPEEEAGAFDELGCVRTEAWRDRDLEIPPGAWRAVEGPEDQAEHSARILAALDGRFAPEDVSIGVCDEEVAPYLERRLSAEGIAARNAAGTPLAETRPFRLLADLAAWLPRRSFAPYAALLRHPDLEAVLPARGVDAAAALDLYHEEHLPAAIDGRWIGGASEPMRVVHGALLAALGDLAQAEPRPLARWPAAVRAFLGTVYAAELDRAIEPQRILVEALSALSDALGEIESLPGRLGARPAKAVEALELVAAIAGGTHVPPPASAPGASEIELLGWLDLPLDDARALVVTGFQEGSVPRSRRDDPFLPDALRRRLSLPSADDRAARDVYAATVILHSKEHVAFVSGRRSRDGDPRLPSRLAFHVPRGKLLGRVAEFLAQPRERPARRSSGGSAYLPPKVEPVPRIDSMRVTDFKAYLASPYGFYLERVLRLETLDDAAREMDPRAFGILAHEALQAFGASGLRDSTDEREIEGFLRARVEAIGRVRYGSSPLPEVELQLAQLGRRLALFARAQARRASEGWRIREVEWQPKTPVSLPMEPGEESMPLSGKIDRIDVHADTGAWAILDYKVGVAAKDPAKAHRKRSGWCDLQLPLYTLLARELARTGEPALGYFVVGKDESETGVRIAAWKPSDLSSALEAAREVVRKVRAGAFDEIGTGFPDEPILNALAGRGLLEAAEVEDEEMQAAEEAS